MHQYCCCTAPPFRQLLSLHWQNKWDNLLWTSFAASFETSTNTTSSSRVFPPFLSSWSGNTSFGVNSGAVLLTYLLVGLWWLMNIVFCWILIFTYPVWKLSSWELPCSFLFWNCTLLHTQPSTSSFLHSLRWEHSYFYHCPSLFRFFLINLGSSKSVYGLFFLNNVFIILTSPLYEI